MSSSPQTPSAIQELGDGPERPEKVTPIPEHEEFFLDGVTPVNDDQLPKGYYLRPAFLGTYFAAALGLGSGVGVFSLLAPNLSIVYVEIGGPGTSIAWAAIMYILMLGVGSTLIGRVTDLFGRRWFMVGGSFLGLIGNVVCSRAQNIPTLVGGMTIIGAGAAAQGSFAFVIGELVPIRYRFIANAGLYFLSGPFNVFGPKTGTAITANLSLGWRWIFYLFIILNGISTACWYLFYHPPTFKMLHRGRETKRQLIRHFDYAGFVMFTAGVTLLMLGLNWGGSIYAWGSANVVSALVIGPVCLIAFFVYEAFASPREPYIPLKLFRNVQYVAVVVTVSTVAMGYYGFSIIWPTLVSTLYPASPSTLGWKFCASGGIFVLGDFTGLVLASYIQHLRYFMVGCMVIGTAFAGAVAVVAPDNETTTVSVMVVGCFFLGIVEAITLTQSSIAIENQDDIGAAVGVAASFRSLGGALASTIYSTILTNRVQTTVAALVPAAVIEAGLPESEIPGLLAVLQGLAEASSVEGLTDRIYEIALDAFRLANAQAYRTCFLTSIAFCSMGLIGAWFCPDHNPEMDHVVAKELHQKKEQKRLEGEVLSAA